jgi:DNA mismatch repair protein MutS2
MQHLGPGPALVLLDELGTGTDPLEGGALACAVLDELSRRNALTVATTHLGVVKTFVHEHADMLNASVRFNTETLQPEFVLDIGRPGASNALSIARRLGLPPHILRRAEKHLSSDHLRLEGILVQMEEEQRRISVREEELQETVSDLARDRTELRTELQALKKERRQLLHDAYRQATGIVENARRQMENMLRELRTARSPERQNELAGVVRRAIGVQTRRLDAAVEQTAPRPVEPVRLDALAPGQAVWVERLQADAEIAAIHRDRSAVTVVLGNARFEVPARELGRPQAPAPATGSGSRVFVTQPRSEGAVSVELNLIGLRVAEALPRLESYLDRAALAGLPEVRIIHGFGTGRLQAAVHEFLRGCGLVRRFRLGKQGEDPGGAGATLATLGGD